MMPAARPASLIDRLPAVRGRLEADVSLARFTWFRVGGPAEVLFQPADVDDLAAFVADLPADVPLTVLGACSNVIVRDGGIPGVVVRLGRAFAHIEASGTRITASSGAIDVNVARRARDAGIGGLEFLVGVPGSVGGALRMNAGAYGREVKDVLVRARALDLDGTIHELDNADMGFAYRRSLVPEGWIFLDAEFEGEREDSQAIAARMEDIQRQREDSQPIRTRTGGSTFANPEGAKAWQLIDAAGCRGLRMGGAMVSEQHCNFLVNTGDATAADLERLGEEVRRRVKQTSGIELHWEIRRIGVPANETPKEVTS